jgi:hypothetical protein
VDPRVSWCPQAGGSIRMVLLAGQRFRERFAAALPRDFRMSLWSLQKDLLKGFCALLRRTCSLHLETRRGLTENARCCAPRAAAPRERLLSQQHPPPPRLLRGIHRRRPLTSVGMPSRGAGCFDAAMRRCGGRWQEGAETSDVPLSHTRLVADAVVDHVGSSR